MNRFIILVILSLFSFHFSIGQSNLSDSLKVVIINSADDTVKVQNMILLSQNLAGSDNANAIYYASRARDLAITLDYKPGLAKALKYMGIGYYHQAEFLPTINYWEQSLAVFEEIGDKAGIANILNNLGAVNSGEGDETLGIEYYLRSLALAEEIKDTLRISTVLLNIGFAYSKKEETYDKALVYYNQAFPLFEKQNYLDGISTVAMNIGVIFFDKSEYDSAQFYLERSLTAGKGTEIEPTSLNYLGRVYARKSMYDDALSIQQESLALAKSYGSKLDEAKAIIGMAETYQLPGEHQAALDLYLQAIPLLQGSADFKNELQEVYEGLSLSFAEVNDFRSAYKYQGLLTAIKDTLFYTANQKRLDILSNIYDNAKEQAKTKLLEYAKALQDAKLEKEKIIKNTFVYGFLLLVIILSISYLYFSVKRKNKIIEDEKKKSDDLLLNILPEETANELLTNGHVNPQKYALSTVLFTDFKEFAEIVDSVSPDVLVKSLDYYFQEFDRISSKHDLEKIKTIGDAYMCVGGIPTPNEKNPIDVLNAAIDMLKFVLKPPPEGIEKFEIRIGIHTGPIIAGIVGIKKFQYDVWGSAVNIASLMETNSEPQKINISQNTYEYVKYEFKCTHRGQIEVKHGKKMDMYFVEV